MAGRYKQWTGAQRAAMAQKTKAAREAGEIPYPSKCNRCGQVEGIIQYHNHDYSHPTKFLEELCWRCHMVHHSRYINPQACIDYWEAIAQGKQFPPVYAHDFGILAREHGIVKQQSK